MRDLRSKFLLENWLHSSNPNERQEALQELERIKEIRTQQSWIVEPLQEMGIIINSVSDLVNTGQPYPEAIPFLLERLLNNPNEPQNYREGYMRALMVKEAKGVGVDIFVREFIWGATSLDFRQVGNDWGHMDVAARAMKEVAIKGESEKIKVCFDHLDKASMPGAEGARRAIRKELEIAYKRAGGKLPL